MGAFLAPLGTRMTVCSFTPSRMGIMTSRLAWSKLSVTGVNCTGVSLGRVAGVEGGGAWATEVSTSKRAPRIGASKVKVRTQWIGFIRFLSDSDGVGLYPWCAIANQLLSLGRGSG